MTKVCIIIPCRNEADRLTACVRSVLDFALPSNVEIQVFIMDGCSSDGTAFIASLLEQSDQRVRYYLNHSVTQGCAVNAAVRQSTADYFLWLSSHTEYPPDYLAKCLQTIARTNAEVVGGLCETVPGGDTYGARVVQAITTHKFGVGGSEFRVGGVEHSVDTVAYALFSRRVFDRVGLLDERLVRAQDYEFNRRVAAAGGVIWQNPAIRARYFNQRSFRAFLSKQLYLEAPYNAYLWYLAPYAFSIRHAVTCAFFAFVLATLVSALAHSALTALFVVIWGIYGLAALIAAISQARRYRAPTFVLSLPFSFLLFHCVHGAGVWLGLIRLTLNRAPIQPLKEPWQGAGVIRLTRRSLSGLLAR